MNVVPSAKNEDCGIGLCSCCRKGGSTIGLSATDAQGFVVVFSVGDVDSMRLNGTDGELFLELSQNSHAHKQLTP
jgi:hypothetical protein